MIVANNVAEQIVFRDDVSSSAGSDQKSKCCDRRFPELLLQTIQSAVEIITKETPTGFPVFSFFEKGLFFLLVLPKGETGDLNLGEVDSARVAQLLKRGFQGIGSRLREASREMTGWDRCTLEGPPNDLPQRRFGRKGKAKSLFPELRSSRQTTGDFGEIIFAEGKHELDRQIRIAQQSQEHLHDSALYFTSLVELLAAIGSFFKESDKLFELVKDQNRDGS